MAWFESGMPEDKVGYGPDAPQLTPAQRQEFVPGRYVRVDTNARQRRLDKA